MRLHIPLTPQVIEITMQELKAALDGAIEAIAARPDQAGPLWNRLLQAVVVQGGPSPVTAAPPLPHYDLTYQLNEIEVRQVCIVG